MRGFLFLVSAICCLWLVAAVGADDAEDRLEGDVGYLKGFGVESDGPALLEYFRSRTVTDEQRRGIDKLIEDLGSPKFTDRQEASRKLTALGPVAVPALNKALGSDDPEVVSRARRCLDVLENQPLGEIASSAARVLAARRPPEAVKVLLDYLPNAPDAASEEEVAAALASLGVRDGKPDAALVAAGKDSLVSRRMAAAGTLARANAADHRAAAREFLNDKSSRVRLFAAQSLVAVGDKAAVPGLIALLEDESPLLVGIAEDLLYQIAEERNSPAPVVGTDAAVRKKYREAWEAWWKANEAMIDLAKNPAGGRMLGFTVVCTYDNGKVGELTRDGKYRWQIQGLLGPTDVQMLSGNRVLISEHSGNLITERDLQGKVLWQYKVPNNPVSCRRLANGNTLIATYQEVLEVDREGKQLFSAKPGNGGMIYDAAKLPNGNSVYVTSNGKIAEVDRTGKEVRVIAERLDGCGYWSSIQPLPKGTFLVALGGAHKAVEIDRTGKIVWECKVDSPGGATRLVNGNTLVASIEKQYVAEIDRDGKEVWRQSAAGRVFRGYRR